MFKWHIIVLLLLVSFQSNSRNGQVTNEIKIVPSQDIDSFADAVSISGKRALIGVKKGGPVNGAGAAYIFEFDGNNWNEVAILEPSDVDFGDEFGSSVSLLGERAAISSISDNNESGSVYIFEFDGNSWLETAKLTSSDSQDEDNFGFSVSLSTDKILIGAPYHDRAGGPFDMNAGAAYIYGYDGTNWQQTIKLTPATDVGAVFGSAVNLSETRAVIGAFNDGLISGSPGGSAFVFEFNGANWVEDQKLKPSDVTDTTGFFGHAASHSGDKIIIGDYIRSRAYIFEKQVNSWVETEIISIDDNSLFGFSVSLSGDKVLIGEPSQNNLTGRAFMYEPMGADWVQTEIFMANDGLQGDSYGSTLDFDGATVLIGAPGGNSVDSNRPAAAYIYNVNTLFKNGFEIITN